MRRRELLESVIAAPFLVLFKKDKCKVETANEPVLCQLDDNTTTNATTFVGYYWNSDETILYTTDGEPICRP